MKFLMLLVYDMLWIMIYDLMLRMDFANLQLWYANVRMHEPLFSRNSIFVCIVVFLFKLRLSALSAADLSITLGLYKLKSITSPENIIESNISGLWARACWRNMSMSESILKSIAFQCFE